jgi:hypothetical protein
MWLSTRVTFDLLKGRACCTHAIDIRHAGFQSEVSEVTRFSGCVRVCWWLSRDEGRCHCGPHVHLESFVFPSLGRTAARSANARGCERLKRSPRIVISMYQSKNMLLLIYCRTVGNLFVIIHLRSKFGHRLEYSMPWIRWRLHIFSRAKIPGRSAHRWGFVG